jgi:hypothetical protein
MTHKSRHNSVHTHTHTHARTHTSCNGRAPRLTFRSGCRLGLGCTMPTSMVMTTTSASTVLARRRASWRWSRPCPSQPKVAPSRVPPWSLGASSTAPGFSTELTWDGRVKGTRATAVFASSHKSTPMRSTRTSPQRCSVQTKCTPPRRCLRLERVEGFWYDDACVCVCMIVVVPSLWVHDSDYHKRGVCAKSPVFHKPQTLSCSPTADRYLRVCPLSRNCAATHIE